MCQVKIHGDHRAFGQLVERWEGPILRLCARMTSDVHRAQDLKQEVFSRVFEKRKDYDTEGRFSTWLWRIALNACYDELRRRERQRQFLREAKEDEPLEQYPDDAPSPDWQTAQLDEGELVRQALLKLPEIYRSVLVLRHYENLKLAKIAEILDVPEGTVNSRMAEALKRLSQLLEPKLGEAKPSGAVVSPGHSGAGVSPARGRPLRESKKIDGLAGETPSETGGTPAPLKLKCVGVQALACLSHAAASPQAKA